MAGAINIRVSAVVSDLISAFQSGGRAAAQFADTVNRDLTTAFSAADRSQRIFDRGIGRLAGNIQSVGRNLSTFVTLPLVGLAGASLKASANMEQAGVSFRVLLKDANLAAQTINELKNFAASTPFEFNDVQAGAKQLLAYGFAVGDLKTLLTDAGNLASGFGVEIGEITRVLGRLKSGDFGEAFERLRDFGIGRDVLEGKGLVFDKSNTYKGSVQQAFTAVQQIIRERFGGQMEEQSKTLGGIASNLQDQFSFALTEIGDKIVTTFNLKEVGANVAATIQTIRNGFNSLPEPVQRFSIFLGAAAAATGPLALGLGTVIKYVPTLISAFTTGIGALTSPIGLVAAAVIGAVALIVTNWDSIKQVLLDTGIWQGVSNLVRTATTAISNAFQVVKSVATSLWGTFGQDIINLGRAAFDTVRATVSLAMATVGALIRAATETGRAFWAQFGEAITQITRGTFTAIGGVINGAFTAITAVFKTVTGTLTGIFKVLTGALTLDWNKFAEGLQNITASVWNGILGLFIAGAKGVGGVVGGLLQSIGADQLADQVRAKVDAVTASVAGLGIALKDTGKAAATAGAAVATVPANAKVTPSVTTGGGTALQNGARDGDAEKVRELSGAIETNNKLIASRTQLLESLPSTQGLRDADRNAIEAQSQALIREIALLQDDNEERRKRLELATRSVDIKDQKLIATPFGGDESPIKIRPTALPELPGLTDFQRRVREGIEATQAVLQTGREQLSLAAAGVLSGIGEAIGRGENPLKAALKGILSILGDYLIQLGTSLLLAATFQLAAAAFPSPLTPVLAASGINQKLAGAGLVLGGGVIKGLASAAFANGGIVSGPTLGLVGEYVGARNNPEVIAPLNKLKDLLPGGGRDVRVRGELKLRNRELVAAIDTEREAQDYNS